MKGRLRRVLREARSTRAVGGLVRIIDRVWWYRVVARSGLVDAGYYAAQRGWHGASSRRAVLDYVVRGFRDGISPNPLFDEEYVARALPDVGRVPALYAYLVSDRTTVQVHPWWPAAARGGALFEEVWAAGPAARVDAVLGTTRRELTVGSWRRAAMDVLHVTEVGDRTPGSRATVLRLIQPHDRDAADRIAPLLGLPDDVAVRLVCLGTSPGGWVSAALAAAWYPGVTASRLPEGSGYADALQSGADIETGALVVLDPRAVVGREGASRLIAGGAEALVGPLGLDADGTVAGVGACLLTLDDVTVRARPLRGHPREDVPWHGEERVPVPLLTGRTFAGPAGLLPLAAVTAGHTGYELEVLSLAARARTPGLSVLVDPGVVVGAFDVDRLAGAPAEALPGELHAGPDERELATQVFRSAGFAVERWAREGAEAAPVLRWVPPHPGARRWAIKTSAPAGPRGDVWGDAHFARGLANALRRRGHHVAVDAFEAAHRPTSVLDDVHVVVRGPFRIAPPDGGVRIEWIISHPDEITAAEVSAFDLVFAVSPGWAERMSASWGVPIRPLLECTDTDLFHPRGLERTDEIVFVGTARGIARPSVVAPLRAGIDVKVYGPDWRGFIPAAAIAATSIPNERLSERYETASVVLNDHWPAMRREGFHAMRPFDVVASGGRVISESVAGLTEIFDGAVVQYRTEAELVELLRADPDTIFPPPEKLAAIAARVREEHSFDARAAVLDRAVRSFAGAGG